MIVEVTPETLPAAGREYKLRPASPPGGQSPC